jgi:hypothetical protein
MFAFGNTQIMQPALGVVNTNGNLALFKEVLPSVQIEGLTYAKPSKEGGKRR